MLQVQIISLHSWSKNSFHPAWERTSLPSLISLRPFLSRLRSGGLRVAPWTGRVRPSLPSLPLPLAASLSHAIYTPASASLTAPNTSPTALCLPVISSSSLSHSSQDGQHVNRMWLREKRKRRDVGWKTSVHLGDFPATEVRPCLRCGHLWVTPGAQPLELSNSRL